MGKAETFLGSGSGLVVRVRFGVEGFTAIRVN